MITVDEALEQILFHIDVLGTEKIPLLETLGRIMAEDVYAPQDIPPLDNSAMDGYALRSEDIEKASPDHPVWLEVIDDLPAGFVSKKTIGKGQAIRIMTGAPVPPGGDVVVPVENTKKDNGDVLILERLPQGDNIRAAGQDVKKGERVVSQGDLIRPAEVGILASVQRSSISVYQRPSVAILCTGDELADVDEELGEGKIISSNSYTLSSQVRDCGAIPIQLGIAKDRKEDIRARLVQGLRADVIISSAGVSVGDYDFVKDVFADLKMEIVFWKVAMQPGRPLAFGTIQGKPVFGLPGNPVSSMVSFEQFVRPSLLKMMGHRNIFRPVVEAVLQGDIHKKPGRRHFMRVCLSFEKGQYVVSLTGDQSSGILNSMVRANGLMVIPEDREAVKAGEKLKVQVLDRNF